MEVLTDLLIDDEYIIKLLNELYELQNDSLAQPDITPNQPMDHTEDDDRQSLQE